MINRINLLGSTGSIGEQTLSVCSRLGIKISALTANRNISLLEQQARNFLPDIVVTADESLYGDLKTALADTPIKVMAGAEALLEAAAYDRGDMTLNAIVGIAGLQPTLAAIRAGCRLALANKESLVSGGKFVMDEAASRKVDIFPVDSEHSAIFQCLNGADGNKINRILLTASGGPFFGMTADMLQNVTKQDALKHPTYSMGGKITVDSATLMNKGLELIEAMWLFDIPSDKIEIVVHPQSIIHSAVEFADGAIIAQLGNPDMALPIQYALTYPRRERSDVRGLNLAELSSLTFFKPDIKTFLCLDAAIRAAKMGGCAPTVLNGANEAAVEAFWDEKISFAQIGYLVSLAIDSVKIDITGIDSIFDADLAAREFVWREIKK